MLEHPDIKRMQLYGTLERETRPLVGECIECGVELYGEDDTSYSDEFIETEHGLVCWNCWRDYGMSLMKEQRRFG